MVDSTQPDPNQQPQTMKPIVLPTNKLDDLPMDAKIELDKLLRRGTPVQKVKTIIEKKWVGQTDALPAAYSTFRAYYEGNKARLEQERAKELEELQKSGADFQNLEEMVDGVANGEEADFQTKYQEIIDFIEDRIAFIQDQQSSGFASPQYETAMVQWAKAKKEVLEKLEKYKSEVDKKIHEADMAFIENYGYELLLEVFNVVHELYGDDKFSEFKEKLKGKIVKVVERAQERFDRDFNEL